MDDVLIDAPYHMTRDMIASLNIACVVRGTQTSGKAIDDTRHKAAKEAGIFNVITSPSDFRLDNIVQRIENNQEAFQAKFDRKMKAEGEFYKDKHSGRNGVRR